MAQILSSSDDLISQFQFERLLNQGKRRHNQGGRRIVLLGKIGSEAAILLAERATFPTSPIALKTLLSSLTGIENIGANDIYSWYLARTGSGSGLPSTPEPGAVVGAGATGADVIGAGAAEVPGKSTQEKTDEDAAHHDLKINIIYPCTPQHIAKYTSQGVRMVTETPHIYRDYIRPYMQSKREAGRLNWVFNIIEGRTEQEDVIYREHGTDEGFLVLPDLNWDRKSMESLHLLALVERRDIWSLRDLHKRHLPWLKHMRSKLLSATCQLYPTLEPDQLKLYVHYQPTYYHFHIHIVNVALEAGTTQATGKAFGLENLISQLETLAGGDEASMADVSLTYFLGEASELWTQIYLPLKQKESQQKE
ncbi:putative mRNA decapping hydrolase [Xylona heveae TC161]|uniref:Putative mRNA decapping hydrolase n=1 Tax=Xylona heveae (strain CBS 132557 / TC161) TaxID=1328760 RepID=A0A165H9X6_XYLHT|nr:putative mRNA decapping hydrolase [Xylona heveae TC161]KZF23191.1 putative mRNA decapping hydrolase [Xylona heveae TC161]